MRCRKNRRNQRGVVTLELILVLPILLIVLVVSVQFGMIALYQAAVTHSATVAVREAGKGADFTKVVAAVQQVVGIHDIDISGSGTKVTLDGYIISHGSEPSDPPLVYGDPSLTCLPPTNAPHLNEVRVTVCVDLAATRFCDALAAWGLSFADRMFRASSLVMKELEQDVSTP
ncbi:MAG: hypothetical protein EOM24_36235 [Chloroflexia bacterium]|nr:hypothetical protein [Chloroflexia bacterium]